MSNESCAPAFLANSGFYGTLAAARFYGENGVPVYLADDDLFGVARWSRHVTRRLKSPRLSETSRFVEWLLEIGAREPGIVLYPTSDDAAFLYSLHRDELSKHYRMLSPSVDVLLEVLDKKKLYAHAQSVGLEVPRTWFPESEADVRRIAREAPMLLLVKPRTQVLVASPDKGVVVDDRDALAARWSAFVRERRHHEALRARVPDAEVAMLQEYLPEAAGNITVLAAFLSEDRKHFAARAAVKLMQRPRNLGIGLCFEAAPLPPELADAARRLAIASGYHGLFQLELVRVGDRHMLIDFNPRFYNQLAFDIARGLPLPMIVHAAARGDHAEAARLVEGARTQTPDDELVFCNAFGFEVLVGAQRIAGTMSASEASRWRSWRASHRARSIDPTRTPDDGLPGIMDACAQLYGYARHPRAFLRRLVLDAKS